MGTVKEFGVGFENLTGREFMATARLAEELGYKSFWVPEDPFFRGGFSLASAIAASTSSIRIGMGIINPYTRHPGLIAMELGALEEVSEGRALLGIGASLKSFVEGQLNIPYVKPGTSVRECVEIIRRLCRGEKFSYEGKVFQMRDAGLHFQPPRKDVPIHLGVIGPKNLELTGEIAEGLLLSAMTSPAYVRYAMEHVRRGAERSGRSLDGFEVGAYLFISISDAEQAARDAVRPFLALLISLVGEHPMFTCTGMTADEIKPFCESFAKGDLPVGLVTDWMVDTFAIAGNAERCREGLAKVIEAGVTHPIAFEIPGVSPEKTMRDVHTHLMPHFL
ncbi:MAG TPA: LLM class flavin-dependent oxidoreductase [Blastocatellia bacterium]|nr:LLM class flavin-dependent oxidoreductase [Blastocatellia bacterium]